MKEETEMLADLQSADRLHSRLIATLDRLDLEGPMREMFYRVLVAALVGVMNGLRPGSGLRIFNEVVASTERVFSESGPMKQLLVAAEGGAPAKKGPGRELLEKTRKKTPKRAGKYGRR